MQGHMGSQEILHHEKNMSRNKVDFINHMVCMQPLRFVNKTFFFTQLCYLVQRWEVLQTYVEKWQSL